MDSERFTVQNVKCTGCVGAIQKGLLELSGVQEVQVDIPTGEVIVHGQELDRGQLSAKLGQLGYPEKAP